ncbi:MAG TPA: efflux RND transporter periplasmic adaptor subunit [Verrucomicrobiae bacterium]|nr:efflux RND transporter periplasmic adaptor subunit [Verrucomicrobiae bacterium]
MIRKYVIPIIAVAGIGFGVITVVKGNKTNPPAPPVAEPAKAPYQTFVAGSGIVEASTENIAIGTDIAGLVTKIYVQIGSYVKAGDPLFTIDDRATRAQIAQQQAAVQVAEANLRQATNQLALAENLTDRRALSLQEVTNRRDAVAVAEAKLAQARADLQATQTNLERLTVRAPVDGQVLQLKVRLGEFAQTGVLAQPVILLGNVDSLNVRVDVDENDAWRVKTGASATAFLRGNRDIQTPLKFVRFEPYVVPKTSLTGDTTERVDTRVLQVVYGFERGELPIYVGQQMDVFIEAPGHNEGGKS